MMPNNPFPAEAVASYGTRLVTCAKLQYMEEPHRLLSDYLACYALEDRAFGTAIALSGEQGSGKTHLLTWLAEKARESATIRSTVLYAKCDSNDMLSLYRALMKGLERSVIIDIIQLALLTLAREKVRSAAMTEALIETLGTVGGLQQLEQQGNLDLDLLRQDLLVKLSSSHDVGTLLARALLDVPSSQYGVEAYTWISGGPSDKNLAAIGVAAPLGAADAETNAIAALEVIAALHQVAGVPLIILVDQAEVVLFTEDDRRRREMGSLIKKLAEQAARQRSLLVIAGMPRAWTVLPPDVQPRFRTPKPLTVGELSEQECRLLLEAYLGALMPLGGHAIVGPLRELSGGSPRDVLRIAHHAFEDSHGDLWNADERKLLGAAMKAGSLETKAQQALVEIDLILTAFGTVTRDLKIGEDLAERGVLDDQGQLCLLVKIVMATDAVDEVGTARRIQRLRETFRSLGLDGKLLVVSVGYSSAEIRRLLGNDKFVNFTAPDFSASFKSTALPLLKSKQPVGDSAGSPAAASSSVDLHSMSKRLDDLEAERKADADRIAQDVALRLSDVASARSVEIKARSRQEILEALDSLEEALFEGVSASRQKQMVRAMLVSNEQYLQLPALDVFGDLYLDLLAAERMKTSTDSKDDRAYVISQMRARIGKSSNMNSQARLRQLFYATLAGLGGFLLTGILSNSRATSDSRQSPIFLLPEPRDLIGALPFLCLAISVITAYAAMFVWLRKRSRDRRDAYDIAELRERFKLPTTDDSLKASYPQARP
ncbi:hypothetical protein [Roseateles sp. P5_E4]